MKLKRTLQQHLDQEGISQIEFARESGLSKSTVCKLLKGIDSKGSTWARVEWATGGAVTPLAHYPMPKGSRARRKKS